MDIKNPQDDWKRKLTGSGGHGRRAFEIIEYQEQRIAELEAEKCTLKSGLLSIQKEWSDYTKQLEQRIAELEEQIKKLEAEKSASVECDENWIEAYQQRYAKLDE